jgi:hypothetical protein
MPSKILTATLAATLVSSSFLIPLDAYARTAQGMDDLIGARGSSLDGELNRRGYKFARSVGVAGMWWNRSSKTCVSALVDDGRVQSIEPARAADCGKVDEGELAGLAIGVAAAGLVAALSHHHKDGDNRNNSTAYNAEFQRGYHDAFYGAHYATNDSEAYHSGYMAGEAERNNRRHANSALVRGAPAAAQQACMRRADEFWDIPDGSAAAVSIFNYGQGNYEVTVASGHRRANCSVTAEGKVTGFVTARSDASRAVVSKPESDCLAAVANQVGNGDVSTISVKRGENQITVQVRVPGAEAPWICEHNATKVTNVFYGSEG